MSHCAQNPSTAPQDPASSPARNALSWHPPEKRLLLRTAADAFTRGDKPRARIFRRAMILCERAGLY
jgi:hypothetical protein